MLNEKKLNREFFKAKYTKVSEKIKKIDPTMRPMHSRTEGYN